MSGVEETGTVTLIAVIGRPKVPKPESGVTWWSKGPRSARTLESRTHQWTRVRRSVRGCPHPHLQGDVGKETTGDECASQCVSSCNLYPSTGPIMCVSVKGRGDRLSRTFVGVGSSFVRATGPEPQITLEGCFPWPEEPPCRLHPDSVLCMSYSDLEEE